MSKLIITGSTGFVGANFKEYLDKSKYNVQELNMRERSWRYKVEHDAIALIHLAGKAHDTTNTSSAEEYFKVNTELTIELFDKFLQSSIRDFFYFSSVKAAADTVNEILIEDVEGSPKTSYGRSKLESERYLRSKELPEGKRLFIIRPCMIHGPGNKGNLNLLYKVVEKGIPWPLAAFHNQRSFLSIDNLCYLLEQMIENENLVSGIYNFADDGALSTNELVTLISHTLGKSPKLWNISSGLIEVAVKMGDVLPLPLNSERLKKLTESYVVSNTKIKVGLGIDKLPINAHEGLEKTIRSFLNSK